MQRAYTFNEFCLTHRVGETRARKEIKEGRLKAVRVGARKIIIRADDAETWLASLASPKSDSQVAA